MTETRTSEPQSTAYWTVVDTSEFGFRIRNSLTGVTLRCAIGWNGQASWFRQREAE